MNDQTQTINRLESELNLAKDNLRLMTKDRDRLRTVRRRQHEVPICTTSASNNGTDFQTPPTPTAWKVRAEETNPMANPKNRVPLTARCGCGQLMTTEEVEFWGECRKCRTRLPVQSRQQSDSTMERAERDYHGGLFHRGEW